ncbi:MAG TPA: Gfo/Idh/MocA family oxidoreductase [Streptosporangiaceae bacterium]|nr:Gfo/Idh/MocA family oxidoreductase [Streptosporangiaceae bacterium]
MTQPASRDRYAIVGTGSRATMYVDAICGRHATHADLVALCDTSSVRVAYHNQRLARRFDRDEVPGYDAGAFGRMLAEQRPDVVIVTTVDAYHHQYIVAAAEQGCDVVSEKPMTTDDEKVAAILLAAERTGRRVRVTFNYRYSPAYTRLRQLVAEGAIGVPFLVDFSWLLDTSHGADYFRRWHREKPLSGGLLVHKASHHFDLVNWWIGDWPETVFAMGSLSFYGRDAAAGRGETYPYRRYTGHAGADPFALDLERSEMLRGLYRDAEEETGYMRDRNVFGDDISIEDTMAVTARYRRGALLSYSLVSYSPWEGLRVAITGDKGRVELYERHGAHVIERDPTGAGHSEAGPAQSIRLFPMFSEPVDVEIPAGGPHAGDALMLEQIFDPGAPPDPDDRAATHQDGAAAVLLGTAANQSIATGLPVRLDQLQASL